VFGVPNFWDMSRLRMPLLFLLVLFLVLSKPMSASAVADEDAASAATIRALTSDDRHYTGKPDGGCSSPIALPAVFDLPCKAHDLGYDVLRAAAAKGHPLGPWARDLLDSTFGRRLHTACEGSDGFGRVTCEVAAEVASAAVRFNSWRQHSGPPVVETPGQILLSLARA
jgi:hypothetical protein